jgi:AcrR family transcriptional regulator
MNPEIKYTLKKQDLFSRITELIKKEGYANLTVRSICHELDISTGTFYHYFPEKNDLARILFSDIDDYFEHVVAAKFGENEPENLITYCVEYGLYVMKSGVETCRCISVAPLKHFDQDYLEESRALFQVLLKILNNGVEKKQFQQTVNPLDTARMLMILLRGYSSDWAKHNGSYDLAVVLESFIRLFNKCLIN